MVPESVFSPLSTPSQYQQPSIAHIIVFALAGHTPARGAASGEGGGSAEVSTCRRVGWIYVYVMWEPKGKKRRKRKRKTGPGRQTERRERKRPTSSLIPFGGSKHLKTSINCAATMNFLTVALFRLIYRVLWIVLAFRPPFPRGPRRQVPYGKGSKQPPTLYRLTW